MGRREEAPGREEAGAALLLLVEKKRERVVKARDSEEARNGRGARVTSSAIGSRPIQSDGPGKIDPAGLTRAGPVLAQLGMDFDFCFFIYYQILIQTIRIHMKDTPAPMEFFVQTF